jgi:hypothetical protein
MLETEAGVINLIGYETAMEFVYIDDYTFTFKTAIPQKIGEQVIDVDNNNRDIVVPVNGFYEVTFFEEENESVSFFKLDSFSNFLEKYQIHQVVLIGILSEDREVLYEKQYQKQ